jgi:hypothetical protein
MKQDGRTHWYARNVAALPTSHDPITHHQAGGNAGGSDDLRHATGLAASGVAELLFVDPEVDDASVLLDGLRPGIKVIKLTPGGGGLEQIAQRVAGWRDVATLHILCPGEPGALVLAGERIDLPALAVRPGVLANIAEALSDDATVLLYGCSVAAGAAGLQFLDYLEAALGVSVAASAGPVGAPALGGRWTLRDRHGAVVETAFVRMARAAFPRLLVR